MLKRLSIFILCALLVCGLTQSSGAVGKNLVKTSTATLDGLQISAVNGTAFIGGVDLSSFVGQWFECVAGGLRIGGFVKTVVSGGEVLGAVKSVTGITKANPGVITFGAGHGLSDGMVVKFVGLTEMTDLNGKYRVLTNNSGNTFQIGDTSSFAAAETTGGNCANQVTTPATGVTISSTGYGATLNWNYKDASFPYNNTAGFTWYVFAANQNKKIASGATAAGSAKVDFTTTNSFADLGAGVFTNYLGSDTGLRRYKLILTSATGSASWWIGAADAAEGLDAERITTWTNNASYLYTHFTTAADAGFGDKIIAPTDCGATGVHVGYASVANSAGELVKYTGTVTLTSGGVSGLNISTAPSGGTIINLEVPLTAGAKSIYRTINLDTQDYIQIYNVGLAGDFTVTSNSLKRVLDVGATGVHLFSTSGRDGVHTRAPATIDSGFNPNLALTYQIVQADPDLGELVYSASVAASNFKYAADAGGSMVDAGATVNLARWAGTDAGLTSYILVCEDSDGDVIYGHMGAAGAGAGFTLSGLELLTNNAFEDADAAAAPGWEYNAAYYAIDGVTNTCVAADGDANNDNCGQDVTAVTDPGKLYYGEITVLNHVSGTHTLQPLSLGTGSDSRSSDGTLSAYSTLLGSSTVGFLFVVGASGGDADFDNASLQQVTDVTTSGVHIHSTKNGNNFTWTTGLPAAGTFYPLPLSNVKLRVYRAY